MKYKIIIPIIIVATIETSSYVYMYVKKQNEKIDEHSLEYARIFTVIVKCKDANRAKAGQWLDRIQSTIDKDFNYNKFQELASHYVVSHFTDYETKGNNYWCQYNRGYLWSRGIKGIMPDHK